MVTGATSGLGKEFIKYLSKNNVGVVICGRNPEKLLALENELSDAKVFKFYLLKIDHNFDDISKFCKEIRDKIKNLPQIDLLINNAGLFFKGGII